MDDAVLDEVLGRGALDRSSGSGGVGVGPGVAGGAADGLPAGIPLDRDL
jgi:hypothetical protein